MEMQLTVTSELAWMPLVPMVSSVQFNQVPAPKRGCPRRLVIRAHSAKGFGTITGGKQLKMVFNSKDFL